MLRSCSTSKENKHFYSTLSCLLSIFYCFQRIKVFLFQLIVLDRLIELRSSSASEKVLKDLVMDILRVLSSSDLEVRKKTLQLALDLVSSRNVEEMVMFLKKASRFSNAFSIKLDQIQLKYLVHCVIYMHIRKLSVHV